MVSPCKMPNLCRMTWLLVILSFIILLLLWLLWAPLQLEIDTRKPAANFKWSGIGRANVWYDEEWWLSFRVFFFHKTIRLASMKAKPKKIAGQRVKKAKRKPKGFLKKMIRVLRSFQVKEWRLAVDTGDYTMNAQLYPLNFFSRLHQHLFVNFNGENYLYIRIQNRPAKMLYAFFR